MVIENRTTAGICFLALTLILSTAYFPTVATGNDSSTIFEANGPFVDMHNFTQVSQDDQQILALQNNEIDILENTIDPSFLDTLEESEDIDIVESLRNGYGYLVVNCGKFPFNFTAFRRAAAFAIDKLAISDEVWDGHSEPLDSVIPKINPFSVEGQLTYSYYDSNVELGNQLLDQAGFANIDDDEFREAPDGSDFHVLIECAQSSDIAIESGALVAEALNLLNINATSIPTDFYEYLNRLYFHGDYDMVFLGTSFNNFNVEWLAYEFGVDCACDPGQNIPHFRNATYDSWRDQLLYSTSYDEVYEAAIEMQKVLVYECPYIVLYENMQYMTHRTDKFEGFVNDAQDGIAGWWTVYNVRLKESAGGPFGGTLRWGSFLSIHHFNFMRTCSCYGSFCEGIPWDTLLRTDPNGQVIPWLAESYKIETHTDNPAVTSGNTRITYQIVGNATWSDGIPLTAEDIAFTINYYRESRGNPYGADLHGMISAYSSTNSFIVEFESESYWHLSTVSYKPILPKHIFKDINWSLWNPDPLVAPMVTSGPFNFTDYGDGYVVLSRNPNYFLKADPSQYPTNSTGNPFDSLLNPISASLTAGSIIVIVGVLIIWKKEG